ncbi:hypothetical protein GLOIN_2v1779851 [Rhizophagus irregularis DAOM 181602=DAOM 197198]|nr:hypothetical protein GLOIN_2v1779851 [Rhizophagus irregularis DAOM 181602=DAOM 197198]
MLFRVGFRRRKTKKPRFITSSGGLPKNENPKIRSGGLPKNENPKILRVGFQRTEKPKDSRSGGLLTFRKRGTKIRFGLASDLQKKWNQDSSRVSRVSSKEWKKPKIHKFG